MLEFKRLHIKWNTLILLIGLILCQIFIYIYSETELISVSEIKKMTSQTKEAIKKNDSEMLEYQTEYFKQYDLYYDNIIKNAERMLGSAEENSFAKQNILKTVEDYREIDGIGLTYGVNDRVYSFTGFKITDYLILVFLVYIVVRFFDGRRTGLEPVVRAGAKGRLGLTVRRVVILAADSAVITGIFYLVQYFLVSYLYGFEDNRLIQSVPEFKECSIVMTEREFFIKYALMKAIILFAFALIIWLIMHIFQSMIVSVAVLALIFAGQYIIYDSIEYTSHYVTAKFINLFAWLDVENLFKKYYNIDIFGVPIGIRQLFFLSLIVIASAIFIILVREALCYGKIELKLFKRLYIVILAFFDRYRRRGFVFGWELKKVLIKSKGIIILIIVAAIVKNNIVSSDLQLSYGNKNSRSEYYKKYNYDISEEMYNDIEAAKDEYSKAAEEYEAALAEYDADRMNMGELHEYETRLDEKSQQQEFFTEVEKDIEYVEKVRENGKKANLITKDSYMYLFNKNNHVVDLRKMIIVLLAAIFMLGGIFSTDRQVGAMKLIKTSGKGRNKLFYSKLTVGMLLITLCTAAMFFVEFYNIWKLYGFDGLECSLYSIRLFEYFPFEISIRGFIILWYVCRWMVIMSVCMLIMCISCMSKSAVAAIWTSTGLLAIPAFLTYMEVPIVKNISVLESMWLMKEWQDKGMDRMSAYMSMLIMWLLGIAAYIMCKKYYRYRNGE